MADKKNLMTVEDFEKSRNVSGNGSSSYKMTIDEFESIRNKRNAELDYQNQQRQNQQ